MAAGGFGCLLLLISEIDLSMRRQI
ncbi:hypothetical protein H8958_021652 [Nasalis larvatus]|nr:PREDICTED: humanin-like 7 [Rhinopithecus bieti]XP_033064891.1 humanin-like 7 [Trachypithecus francoisi]